MNFKTLDLDHFQTVPLKHEAHAIATRFMSPGIDWISVVYCSSAIVAYFSIFVWGASLESIAAKIALGMTLQLWLGFVCFNFTHEVAHGLMFKNTKTFRHLNSFLGNLVGLVTLTPYLGFKETHLEHHRHTNDTKEDPNYWILRGNLFFVIAKIVLAMFFDHHAMNKYAIARKRWDIVTSYMLFWILVSAMTFVLSQQFGLINVLLLWLLPAYFSFSLVFMAVAVIPHRQSPDAPAPQVNKIIMLPKYLQAVSTFLHAGHNYHLLHHLFPRIPSHHYSAVARELFELQNSKS